MSDATRDAERLGWVRKEREHAIEWFTSGPDAVVWWYDYEPTSWFARNPGGHGRRCPTEDAALTAAIDATPNARRLLAVMAECERLRRVEEAAKDVAYMSAFEISDNPNGVIQDLRRALEAK